MVSKYDPLEQRLRDTAPDVKSVTLQFRELEILLGSALPASARTYRPWWANQADTKNRPQAHAWMSAGFFVETVKISKFGGWVRFVRA
jgi:hypothetical protein